MAKYNKVGKNLSKSLMMSIRGPIIKTECLVHLERLAYTWMSPTLFPHLDLPLHSTTFLSSELKVRLSSNSWATPSIKRRHFNKLTHFLMFSVLLVCNDLWTFKEVYLFSKHWYIYMEEMEISSHLRMFFFFSVNLQNRCFSPLKSCAENTNLLTILRHLNRN